MSRHHGLPLMAVWQAVTCTELSYRPARRTTLAGSHRSASTQKLAPPPLAWGSCPVPCPTGDTGLAGGFVSLGSKHLGDSAVPSWASLWDEWDFRNGGASAWIGGASFPSKGVGVPVGAPRGRRWHEDTCDLSFLSGPP